jgi:integrase
LFFENDRISILSDSLKSNLFIILKASIDYGIKKKYRKKFTVEKIQFKKNKNEITYFTKKEEELLVDYLTNNMNLRNLSILLGLFSGIRVGEICGLRWSDLDFIYNTLSVNRTAQRIKNLDDESSPKTKLVVDKPKTESSIRIIPLPEILVSILKKYKQENDCYVFTNNTIIPKDPRAVEKYFASVLKRVGIKELNFHSLRHTFATRLREQNVDIKVISELLGHSDWKITQSIYVHASLDYKRDSVDTFNRYLPC